MSNVKTIIFTGGGTAGHIAPNIALFPYFDDYEIHYCGAANSMEERMLKAYPRVAFHALPCVKLRRSLSVRNCKVPFVLWNGIRQAKKLLREVQPRVVFGKGGYAALPVALAAVKCDVPLVVHESDISMGLSNRLVAKKARWVLSSFPSTARDYESGVFTGTPLRRELYAGKRENVIKAHGFSQDGLPNLLVFGGSQGALALNTALESALDRFCAHFHVLHIAGKHPFAGTHKNYRRVEFTDNMADCYAWADYAVCRAGAGTLAEITALCKPALVIPLPKSGSSRGDQEQNADYYREAGCIEVLPQSELTPETLLARVLSLPARRAELISAMQKAPSPDGTQKIAQMLRTI